MTVKEEKLAYLLGAIYGDGSFTNYKRIYFGSTDPEFTTEIVKIISDLFKLKININLRKFSNPKHRPFFYFQSRRLFQFISGFDLKKIKKIPNLIVNGNEEVKASFIRGFYDAECNVDIRSVKRKDGRTDVIRHVKCFSNDRELLKQIKQFLTQLKIKLAILRGKKENYYVCIWNYRSLKKFNELIGFVIKRKQMALVKALNSYKKIQTQWNSNTYNMVMNLRCMEKIGAKRIKNRLLNMGINVPQPTIESWIYGRSKISEKIGGV